MATMAVSLGLALVLAVIVGDVRRAQVSQGEPLAAPEAHPVRTALRTQQVPQIRRDCRQRLPGGRTRFGTSLRTAFQTTEEALAGQRSKYSSLPVVRVFDPSLPPRDIWTRRGGVLAGVDTVTSFRASPAKVLSGALDGALRQFFETAPHNREVYWSFNHEPEPEIEAGMYSAAAYRSAWRHLAALAHAACNPRLHATLILSGFTTEPASKRDWRDYYPGGRVIDVLGWDVYNGASGRASRYPDPTVLFGPAIYLSSLAHKPFAITEMGTPRTRQDPTGRRRADWLTRAGAYLAGENALFVTYFDSTRDGQFLLDDPSSVAAWRDLVRQR